MTYYEVLMARRAAKLNKPVIPTETIMICDTLICEKGVPTSKGEMQRRAEEAGRLSVERQYVNGRRRADLDDNGAE